MRSYIYLLSAVLFEVIGTTLLKVSDGFTNILPSLGVIVFFGLSFMFLIQSLKKIALSFAYSIWAGLGTAGAGLSGVLFFDEILSLINIVGFVIIIAGVIVMNSAKNIEEGME